MLIVQQNKNLGFQTWKRLYYVAQSGKWVSQDHIKPVKTNLMRKHKKEEMVLALQLAEVYNFSYGFLS